MTNVPFSGILNVKTNLFVDSNGMDGKITVIYSLLMYILYVTYKSAFSIKYNFLTVCTFTLNNLS